MPARSVPLGASSEMISLDMMVAPAFRIGDGTLCVGSTVPQGIERPTRGTKSSIRPQRTFSALWNLVRCLQLRRRFVPNVGLPSPIGHQEEGWRRSDYDPKRESRIFLAWIDLTLSTLPILVSKPSETRHCPGRSPISGKLQHDEPDPPDGHHVRQPKLSDNGHDQVVHFTTSLRRTLGRCSNWLPLMALAWLTTWCAAHPISGRSCMTHVCANKTGSG